MRLLLLALRRPFTILALTAALVFAAGLALVRMPVDVFPRLDLPVIYVAQPFGGMAPSQMEGYLVNYYEANFLYLTGLLHVESRSIQNVALIKLSFQPGTDMNAAEAETIAYIERSRAYMPPNTVAPFLMRFDADSVPVGDLVFSSPRRSQAELDDFAQVRVRPILARIAGAVAPPPFGGNPRTVVIALQPGPLESHGLSPDDVLKAVVSGNTVLPAGNLRTGDFNRMVQLNTVAQHYQDLLSLPLRTGSGPTLFLRDVATIETQSDIVSGYAELNGRRVIYIPVAKRTGASTLAVVRAVRAALPAMRGQVPEDVHIDFDFDQSVYVRESLRSLLLETLGGALLTALAVWLFLRDPRSAAIVVCVIPLSLLAAVVGLWFTGQTINIMTLGGLALAVGVLVDEVTVMLENLDTHLGMGKPIARAALDSGGEVLVPRLLAMLAVVAVFLPSFLMSGVGRSLFVPLSLAVGFAMAASWLLSSTLAPLLAIWWLRPGAAAHHEAGRAGALLRRLRHAASAAVTRLFPRRRLWIAAYLLGCFGLVLLLGNSVGADIFPATDTGQFQMRLRLPTGTRLRLTEAAYLKALAVVEREAGPGNVSATLGFVGAHPRSYPVNNIYLWTSGSHEAVMHVALRSGAPVSTPALESRLRRALARELPQAQVSFEAGDIISQVMNLGSPAPIQVNVSGLSLDDDLAYARLLRQRLTALPELQDVQYGQSRAYPAVLINADRERLGQLGLTMQDVGRSITEVTASSRFVARDFWQDPDTGVTYQVQVQIPPALLTSVPALTALPLANARAAGRAADAPAKPTLLGDVVQPSFGTVQGEYDHYDLQRMLSLTANLAATDLGHAAASVRRALRDAPPPPRGVRVALVGQVEPMDQTLSDLALGLGLAVVVIFLLLLASFQSWRLALVVLSAAPAVLAGVVLMLLATGTTMNLESFMGSIMAMGIAVANGILLVTLAEQRRLVTGDALLSAAEAAARRLRPILMTTAAMVAGMIPMALALEAGSEQSAPLGRAVIGGLIASTIATLFLMPLIFAALQKNQSLASSSLDPGPGHSHA